MGAGLGEPLANVTVVNARRRQSAVSSNKLKIARVSRVHGDNKSAVAQLVRAARTCQFANLMHSIYSS